LLTNEYGMPIGGFSKYEYTRRLPGRPQGIVAICKKPKYSKTRKKKMAERPMVKQFCNVNTEASVIWHDPVQKAEWAERHRLFQKEAKRRNEYEYPRLWDYIRHVLNEEKSAAQKSVKN